MKRRREYPAIRAKIKARDLAPRELKAAHDRALIKLRTETLKAEAAEMQAARTKALAAV